MLSRGWEWGLESLPLALPHKRHHLRVHRAGAQGVKSARNLQRLEPGRGRRGKEGVEDKGKQTAGRQRQEPPPQGPGPWAPSPKRGPALPGVVLSPRSPASTLQLCVPRRVGCRISSQALAACSVFPNPPVGEGGSPVRIRVPPPLPLPAPFPSLPLSLPPARFPNSFPNPTLAPAPPIPTSIGPQVPSSGWKGPSGSHNSGEALVKPYSAGQP